MTTRNRSRIFFCILFLPKRGGVMSHKYLVDYLMCHHEGPKHCKPSLGFEKDYSVTNTYGFWSGSFTFHTSTCKHLTRTLYTTVYWHFENRETSQSDYAEFNPFMPSGFFYLNSLDTFISRGGASGQFLLLRCCKDFYALRKHAYSNILKVLQTKMESFQVRNSDIFHIRICSKHRLWVLVRTAPRLGEAVLPSTHNLCVLAK